jgi:hypothetical protein
VRHTGAGKDRIFEGDPAPTDCFEELVSIRSENAIGTTGKERLVPWLHRNPARRGDYTVLVTDPRPQSPTLRDAVQALRSGLPPNIRNRVAVINADSPAENRRWLKKANAKTANSSGIGGSAGGVFEEEDDDGPMTVFSDEKMQFLRAYTALGEDRWSMCIFVIAAGRVQRLAREVDEYGVVQTVCNAVQALSEAPSLE